MQPGWRNTTLLAVIWTMAVGVPACENEEIPTSLSPPFAQTNVAFSKTTLQPRSGTVLPARTSQTIEYEVSYTLAPADYKGKDSVSIYIYTAWIGADSADFGAIDQLGEVLESATESGALTFSVPAQAQWIMLAGVVFRGDSVCAEAIPYLWPVQ